jgi:hypothetical protein
MKRDVPLLKSPLFIARRTTMRTSKVAIPVETMSRVSRSFPMKNGRDAVKREEGEQAREGRSAPTTPIPVLRYGRMRKAEMLTRRASQTVAPLQRERRSAWTPGCGRRKDAQDKAALIPFRFVLGMSEESNSGELLRGTCARGVS